MEKDVLVSGLGEEKEALDPSRELLLDHEFVLCDVWFMHRTSDI